MKIAVLGGGNGCFAAAADFTLAGHEVALWRRDAAAVAAQREAGNVIAMKDHRGRHEAAIPTITTDMAEALAGADLVLCPAARPSSRATSRLLAAPHLRSGQVVFPAAGTFGGTGVFRRWRSAKAG